MATIVTPRARAWRVVAGSIMQESNSFSPRFTDLLSFDAGVMTEGPRSFESARQTGTELGGFLDEATTCGVALLPTVHYWAGTGGPILATDRNALVERFLARLDGHLRNGPIDGVLLALHGAWLAVDDDDLDGTILSRVRDRVGPDPVVVCTLDLHANVTQKMADMCDAIVGYATYPHIDMRETGQRAAQLLFRALQTGTRPSNLRYALPMVVPPENSQTSGGPMAKVKNAEAQLQDLSPVISSSVFTVQPWLNIPDISSSIVAVIDGEPVGAPADHVREEMRRVARELWDVKEAICVPLTEVDRALLAAFAKDPDVVIPNALGLDLSGPVLLVDSADSPSAGACGDSSAVLSAILRNRHAVSGTTLLTIVDPGVAQVLVRADGTRVTVDVGGALDRSRFLPVRFGGTARKIDTTRIVFGAGVGDGLTADLGVAAVLEGDSGPDSAPGVQVLVMSNSVACYDPAIYQAVGLDPAQASIVVVKSATNFRWTYRHLARGWIYLATAGAACPDLLSLPYTRQTRPIWPWVREVDPFAVSNTSTRLENGHHRLQKRASRVLPGGVTAGARANAALGHPFYVKSGAGAKVVDVDGRSYLDLVTSNGAALVGHGHPVIVEAVERAMRDGMPCAYDGPLQVELADRLCADIPSFERVRFTTSGTEATFYATRLARAATGRTRLVKFEGHFHGYNDSLAFSMWPSADPSLSGPNDRPRTLPETAGLSPHASSEVTVVPFNDLSAFLRVMDEVGDETAAVILEPINYDAGCVLPAPGFLERVRHETAHRGIILIFDEILSGYRTGLAGAQGHFGVTPDLATVGKALGGGVPISAFGGRADLMDQLSPLGSAVHTGTYNAHPVPVSAALAFLDVASSPNFFPDVIERTDELCRGLDTTFRTANLPVRVQGYGARFALYFGLPADEVVTRYRQGATFDRALQRSWCRAMATEGVYTTPVWHHGISSAHTHAHVAQIVRASANACAVVAQDG